jgi:hypothetical protein
MLKTKIVIEQVSECNYIGYQIPYLKISIEKVRFFKFERTNVTIKRMF